MKHFGTVLVSAFALAFLGGCEAEDEAEPIGTETIEDTDQIGPADGYDANGYDTDTDPGIGTQPFETQPSPTQPLETQPLEPGSGAEPAGPQLDLGDLDVNQDANDESAPDVGLGPAVDEEPASQLPD